MHDFPPVVPGSPITARQRRFGLPARDFGAPDVRGPVRFLIWLNWQQASALAVSSLLAVIEFVPGSVGPFIVGTIIDRGILAGDPAVVLRWSGLLLVLALFGAAAGIGRHTFIVRTWLVAMYGTTKLVTRKSVRLGHVLTRRTPAGEVLSVSGGDSNEFGALTEVTSRAVGAFAAYLIIAGIVLSTSLRLGIVVLVAAPLLVILAMPLLRPMQRRQEVERNRNADLTSLATDIVAGLRILRGHRRRAYVLAQLRPAVRVDPEGRGGGRSVAVGTGRHRCLVRRRVLGRADLARSQRGAGRRPSRWVSWSASSATPCSWSGRSRRSSSWSQKWVRATVSARKAIALLGEPTPWREPSTALTLPLGADIVDRASGFVGRTGRLTVVVSGLPDDSAALADRLGRYLPSEEGKPVNLDVDAGAKGQAARSARAQRRQERIDAGRPGRRAGRPAAGGSASDRSIWLTLDWRTYVGTSLVSDTGSVTFAGTLQELVDPHRPAEPRAGRAGAAHGGGRGRVRGAAGRLAGTDRRAWPRTVRRSAAAAGAGAGAGVSTPRSWCWSSRHRPSTPTPRR